MAEHVQAALDLMVAPLADLQERHVFTPQEIHAIVDRRRKYEYLLRRRVARKEDFLRYIQDEVLLEKLRALRCDRMRQEEAAVRRKRGDQEPLEVTKHVGDKHIVQNIHLLYKRLFRKFRSDHALYVQYADFLKERKAYGRLKQLYTQVLQIFPKSPDWWIEAASHEYFVDGSISAARILFQRGLRFNAKSPNLWLQYFGLELHLVQKMYGRRQILLQSASTTTTTEPDDGEDDTNENKKKRKSESENIDKDDMYQIARLIHDNAIQAIPDNVTMRVQFVQLCYQFPSQTTSKLKQHIMGALQRDCCRDKPEAWIAAAQCHWQLKEERDETEGVESAVGFLSNQSEEKVSGADSNATNEDELEEETSSPSRKKKRLSSQSASTKVSTPTASDDSNNNIVLTLMREATRKIPSSEMYLQAIKLLLSYLQSLESQQEEQEKKNPQILACQHLVEKLFQESAKLKDFAAALLLEHVEYLVTGNKLQAAIARLENFINKGKNQAHNAALWIKWADLQYQHNPSKRKRVIDILSQACTQIPMSSCVDHMHVLLQLLGAKLAFNYTDPWSVLERILVLAPGCKDMQDLEAPAFGVSCVADACLQYLLHIIAQKQSMATVRKTYQAVLFRSSLLENISSVYRSSTSACYKEFIETCLHAEHNDASPVAERRKHLERIYEAAIKAFNEIPSVWDEYRQRRDDEVRYGSINLVTKGLPASDTKEFSVPVLDASNDKFSAVELEKLYRMYHVVHVKNSARLAGKNMNWRDVSPLFESLSAADKGSWCVENDGGSGADRSPAAFLKPVLTSDRAYCSFLVQKDQKVYDRLVAKSLPFTAFEGTTWMYEKALWFFYGRNPIGSQDLQGRPDHTDSVTHDGTFHWQLSATKVWVIHPSKELVALLQGSFPDKTILPDTRFSIECDEGDILVINTRLWFHQTVIPPQRLPSVSYARDFRFVSTTDADGNMTNVDGLYATDAIEEGTIIFTEQDMPDCELHRSSVDPNCEVVELEDGVTAVVARRDIVAGEFFCVADSEDDDSGSDESGEDDE